MVKTLTSHMWGKEVKNQSVCDTFILKNFASVVPIWQKEERVD